jgi:hypothetical protein
VSLRNRTLTTLEWTGYDDATRHNCRPRHYPPPSGRADVPFPCSPATAAAQSAFPPDSTIQALLDQRVSDGRAAGLVFGLIDADGSTRILSAGTAGPGRALGGYADYTVAQMYEFLAGYVLPRDPGAQFEYSNLGVGLLGHALALRAQTSYEELLRERVLEPLDMKDTGITLSPTAPGSTFHGA